LNETAKTIFKRHKREEEGKSIPLGITTKPFRRKVCSTKVFSQFAQVFYLRQNSGDIGFCICMSSSRKKERERERERKKERERERECEKERERGRKHFIILSPMTLKTFVGKL
jgi:cobalamin-dependent methionine synthase I